MTRSCFSLLAALAAVSLVATACGPKKHEKGVDATAEPSPNETAAPAATTAAPPATPEPATPMETQVDDYLKSGQTAEHAFRFQGLSFAPGGELQQNPNFSPTTLAAVLNAYPRARLQIRGFAAPGEPVKAGSDRAAKVAQALIRSGVDASRVTSAGAVSARAGEDRVDLVVTP